MQLYFQSIICRASYLKSSVILYSMDLSRIEIFYDGMSIEKYAASPYVKGFTTNCTVFSKGPEREYRQFYTNCSRSLSGRSLSFQIWEDSVEAACSQIDSIYAIDPSIFVKIPIINSEGIYNNEVYKHAMSKKMNINSTCIYTIEQITKAYELFKEYTNSLIISVFAGPISDTGIDSAPIISYAVATFKGLSNVKILWAGCREIYTIQRAIDLGCHIITMPDTVIDKLSGVGLNLVEASINRVKTFRKDALLSGLSIN